MKKSVDRVLQYCTGIANEFDARRNRIRAFVPDHNPTSGAANEIVLRDFLSRLSANRYKVGQGFICDPADSDTVSKQCDILVYDQQDYPLVYSEGGVDVVHPHAVKILIEVKTGLKRADLKGALENIRTAKRMNSSIKGVVFAFTSDNCDAVAANLREHLQGTSLALAPIAILLLNRDIIIHRWPESETGGGGSPYEVRSIKNGMSGIVMAFLLLLFFEVQMAGVWGGASVENLMTEMLADNTELKERLFVGAARD